MKNVWVQMTQFKAVLHCNQSIADTMRLVKMARDRRYKVKVYSVK